MHYTIVLLAILMGGYFMFSGTNDNLNSNKVNGYQQFNFTKEGELTFQNEEGEFKAKIDIEIADDMVERAVGLMYRENMDMNKGMLFIFPEETWQSFWMKNTVLPLDIIFINKKMEIVTIHKNTTPFSEQSYPSTEPAIYVVEVNAGYTDQFNIFEGDKISWRVN